MVRNRQLDRQKNGNIEVGAPPKKWYKKEAPLKQIFKFPPGRLYKISQKRSIRYLKSHISNIGVNFFIYLKKKIFCGEKLSTEEF